VASGQRRKTPCYILAMSAAESLSDREIHQLGEAIADTAAHIDAATHRLLQQIRAFDACAGWHRQGALSCAHWLNWRVGIAMGAAREKVRVARKLAELPRIDDALRTGQLSYSKVRAMTRVATAANEELLLHMARHMTAAQLEKTCRLLRSISPNPDEADDRPELTEDRRRWVRARDTDDGMVRIEVQLRPDEAVTVLTAMDACSESGRPDGLVAMAEAALNGAADNPRAPVQVMLHVDSATLAGHLNDGVGVSAD
jgi:hypothetical protein